MTSDLYLGSRSNDPTQKEMLSLKYANRHGLIAGATGTGKTVTLQGMAEGFSKAGVPVFMSDVKGDLSGMAQKSEMQDFLTARAKAIGFADEYAAEAFPVAFWDLFGEQGHPLRTTASEMGPLLIARILELNDTQEGVLNIAFRIADEEGLLLLDLKDLRSLLVFVGERASALSLEYGNISAASIGAIQRKLLQLESQGGTHFFGEPALDLYDFLQIDSNGKGTINILAADRLMQTPRLYATFLLWLLSELFEELPEVGDPEKPKLVFFFDEAHLLFDNAPRSLLEKIEQVIKLIRSKGVGIYFVTQNPADIPESVLSQLGNRVQHALRSFTAQQRKAIKLAAQTYRENPEFRVETAITELGVGEALVSTLEEKGQPGMVQKVLIRPPSSRLGPADKGVRQNIIQGSRMHKKYGTTIDRQSAYETLKERSIKAAGQNEKMPPPSATKPKKGRSRQSPAETFIKSMVSQVGRQIGREIMRSVLGSIRR
ncbi:MAG: DUF853 family protein [Alphaproteobacteria bacterium]|nr:DUF853 family protein [Alphaproteobacteria bacterium]